MTSKSSNNGSSTTDVTAAKYVGIAKVRRILDHEWEKAGVKNQKSVQWNERNGFTVMGSDLTADAIKCLEHDDGMVLIRDGQEENKE